MTYGKSVLKIREIAHRVCQNTPSVFLLKLFMILKSRDSNRSNEQEVLYCVDISYLAFI